MRDKTYGLRSTKVREGEVLERAMASPAMLAELERVYAVLDTSCDGRVDRTEIHAILAKLMNAEIPTRTIDRLMEKLDTNRDGLISWEEFRAVFVSSAASARAPRVHRLVHDVLFGGSRRGPPLNSVTGAPDLLRPASSGSVDALRSAQAATDDESRIQHAECWTFLGGDGPFIELTMRAQLGLDIDAEAADVLQKLTDAINFFDSASGDEGARQAISVVTTAMHTNTYNTDATNALKNLVRHIGVVSLFSSPEQRSASYHRLVRLFDLALSQNLGELFIEVLHSATAAIEIGEALDYVALIAALGAFFFIGGPRLPHLSAEDRWQASKQRALVETCRFGGRDEGNRLVEVCLIATRYVAFAERRWRISGAHQHVLTSLLLLGMLSAVTRIATPSGAEYALPVHINRMQRTLSGGGMHDGRAPFAEVEGFFRAARNLEFGDFSIPIQRAASAYFAIAMGFSHEVRLPISGMDGERSRNS